MASPRNVDLDKKPANFQPLPLTHLTFQRRAASVFPNYRATIHGTLRRNYSEIHTRSWQLASALAQ